MTAERPRETEIDLTEKSVLTPHQREILILLAEGRTQREVAFFLGLSSSTIKNILGSRKAHGTNSRSGIYERLGAWSETSAIVEALKQGIIQLEDIRVQGATSGEIPVESISLTERQTEILKLAAEGKNNFEIGLLLGIKERTVKNQFSYRKDYGRNHVGIFERLQVSSRPSAVVRALQLGIFSLEDISSTSFAP